MTIEIAIGSSGSLLYRVLLVNIVVRIEKRLGGTCPSRNCPCRHLQREPARSGARDFPPRHYVPQKPTDRAWLSRGVSLIVGDASPTFM
jgi:hypothetical protein